MLNDADRRRIGGVPGAASIDQPGTFLATTTTVPTGAGHTISHKPICGFWTGAAVAGPASESARAPAASNAGSFLIRRPPIPAAVGLASGSARSRRPLLDRASSLPQIPDCPGAPPGTSRAIGHV